MEETAAALVGFYPAFSPLFPPTPFSLFLSLFSLPLFFYIKQLYLLPIHPFVCTQHACVQSALTALASPYSRLRWLQSSFQQCHTHKDLSAQGKKKKKNFCVTNDAAQCILFQYRKKSDSYLKIFFFVFVFFSLRSGLNVARNTNSCLCVRTCIQNGIITTVLDVFLYNNLSFLNFFFF